MGNVQNVNLDDEILILIEKLNGISEAIVTGNFGLRLDYKFISNDICRFKKSLNQILEMLELNTSVTMIGENSLIDGFIDAFSSFSNRDFSRKLEISEQGTFLDAIAAGINMLGEELENSTVSKNELEIERNRLNHSQQIANIGDWEYYFDNKNFVFSDTFSSVLEIEVISLDHLFSELQKKLILPDFDSPLEVILNIRNNSVFKFDCTISSVDGSVKYLMNIVNHICDKNHKHIGYKGVVQDITPLKNSQMKLQNQTDLQKMITQISSGFISNGFKIRESVERVLETCTKFFQVDRTYYIKFKGTGPEDLDIFEFNNANVDYNTKELFTHKPELFELCLNTVKANSIVQYANTSIVDDPIEQQMLSLFSVKSFLSIPVYGNEKEFAIFGMDCISNYKVWSDDELNGLKIIANIISDAINRDYFEKSLIVARQKAEESDRLKTAFLMNMSHEIRTPMNGILGFLPLLEEPSIAQEQKQQYIDIVNKSGQRLMDTINDIIEISRIEAGENEVLLKDTDLNEVMQYHLDFFAPQAQQKGLQLIISEQLKGDSAIIKSDKNKIYGILTNLIKNAIKFTTKGSIKFGNRIEGDNLLFFVEDTGHGIPADRQKAIFERFVQADIKLTRAHEGSGLGLTIAKAYAKALKGQIWVKSELGIGSIFYFSIPLVYSKVKVKNYMDGRKSIKSNSENLILIAEDDDASYEFLKVILNQYNYSIIRVENGIDAVEMIKENKRISLILMDIKMPDMDGLEATSLIREFNKDLPIIAQTAHAFSGEREKAFKVGCNGYLTKPIRSIDLINKIKEFID
jgi:signal transduction histidine kinase